MFLGIPSSSFICFAAANQLFGADDGGRDGILYNAVRDYVSQDCANNNNCCCCTKVRMANEFMVCRERYRYVRFVLLYEYVQ